DLEDVGIERLVREAVLHLVVVEAELHGALAGAVQDSRNAAQATQAAARTFPLIAPELSVQIEADSHFLHSIYSYENAGPATNAPYLNHPGLRPRRKLNPRTARRPTPRRSPGAWSRP